MEAAAKLTPLCRDAIEHLVGAYYVASIDRLAELRTEAEHVSTLISILRDWQKAHEKPQEKGGTIMATEPPPALLLMLKDAGHEAESARAQLQEVTELLDREEYVRAHGAFLGLEERVHYIGTVLRRFARHLGFPQSGTTA